ncbi:hypothetical protein F5144DRAFT_188754 [Chaetomium tenue]|uniref:Uncharacterized protein n=1 Tax=Chaetomium tenue TaxID=1854479 RepID=A0ACB7PCZ6_9PEZI|nr:hypothetical protein F5144DRAFT_188754 [Chaetomium globosum]
MDPTDAPGPNPDVELPSTDSHETTAPAALQQAAKPPPTNKRESWLSSKAQKLASWLATTEPSAQALRQYRKEAFKKAGISPHDTEPPHARLQAPIGDIPADAIRPASGPTPEAMARRKAADRRKKRYSGQLGGVFEGGQTSSSSGSQSIYRGAASDSLSSFPYGGSSN